MNIKALKRLLRLLNKTEKICDKYAISACVISQVIEYILILCFYNISIFSKKGFGVLLSTPILNWLFTMVIFYGILSNIIFWVFVLFRSFLTAYFANSKLNKALSKTLKFFDSYYYGTFLLLEVPQYLSFLLSPFAFIIYYLCGGKFWM